MKSFREQPAAQLGRVGELLVVGVLRRDFKAGVIASFMFSGENGESAPSISFHDEAPISIPDADVSVRGRDRFWLEIKTYGTSPYNEKLRCNVHGVAARLVEQYTKTEETTGTAVYLAVLEVDTGALMVSNVPISKMTPRYPCLCGCHNVAEACQYRTKWGSSYPQWYFRREMFTEWYRLRGHEHDRLKAEHERVSHAIRRHGATREKAPQPLVPPKPPWTWACLVCDVTGVDSSAKHVCKTAETYRRDYWMRRLNFAIDGVSHEQLETIVGRPIERMNLAKWLGPSWLPSGDIK